MATAAVPRNSQVAYKSENSRLGLAQFKNQSNSKYSTIPPIHSSKTSDDVTQGHSGSWHRKETYGSEKRSGTFLSLKALKEQNRLVSDDASLTFRSLPPIKISLRRSKTKFMESPRRENSSILHPSYSLKTHRPGHHVFTEGISDISKVRSPSFSLKNIPVPYSNLPDNIAIYKEKDKFAFGVKADTQMTICTSPYKLSESQPGYANAKLLHHLDDSKTRNKKGNVNNKASKSKLNKNAENDKSSFQCKFAPHNEATNKEFVMDYPIAGRHEELAETPAPENTLMSGIKSRNPTKHGKERERSVSVISIGESVTPTFFDRPKRKTRKLYPMYDWKTSQREALTKSKFGVRDVNCTKISAMKPELKRSNTKLSTTLLDFELNDNKDNRKYKVKKALRGKFTPISGLPTPSPSKQVPQSVELVYDSDPEFNLNKIYNPNPRQGRYQLRKFHAGYRKQGPRSVDSGSSTDVSTLLQNPPPSEMGHSVFEDVHLLGGGDGINEMVTLMEEKERTKTASMISATVLAPRDNVKDANDSNANINNLQEMFPSSVGNINVEVDPHIERSTDENNVVSSALIANVDMILPDSNAEAPTSQTIEVARGDNVEVKADQGVDNNKGQPTNSETGTDEMQSLARMVTDFELTIVSEYKEDPNAFQNNHKETKAVKNKSKTALSVPKVSLDKLSHNPSLPFNPNSQSLSRLLQNTQVDTSTERKPKVADKLESDDGEVTEDKIRLPITQIHLYSPDSTRAVLTPAVSLVDQFNGYLPTFVPNENLKSITERSDKQLVNSTNISFTSPLVTEPKAKRQ